MKRKIFLIAGLALTFGPLICQLPPMFQMLGIFIGSIVLWLTQSIEIGSISCLGALCLLPGVTSGNVFSSGFGNNTIMFLIFSCLLTFGLKTTGVLRKFAVFFIDNPISKKSSKAFMGMYFLSMLILGSFIAPTTLFMLYFGIAEEIFELLGLRIGDKLARNMMVGTGFYASISCAMTPIAHTFPIMALGYYEASTGMAIPYLTYMKYSLPIGLILAVIAYALLSFGISNDYNFDRVRLTADNWNPITGKFSLIVFIGVVIVWLITGVWPNTFAKLNTLGTAFPAIVGSLLLIITGCYDITRGLREGIPWSAIFLCSATLALGSALKTPEFGILTGISGFLTPILTSAGTLGVLLIIVSLCVILTNLISNIVTTTVSYNLIVPMLIAASGLFSPVVATILIGICASLAYALPSSIAHIALAGSSGWANNKDMLKYGSIMVVISIIITTVIGALL